MRLGFDIDEVINDLATRLVEEANAKFGTELTRDVFVHHTLTSNVYANDPTFSKRISDYMANLVHDLTFIVSAKPTKDALKHLKLFKKAGNTLYYITSREHGKESITADWLRKYKIPFNGVYHVGDYGDKGPLGRQLCLDFYLDDYEPNLEQMHRYKSRWRKGLGLLTRPWNKTSIDGSRFVRFDNWQMVLRYLGASRR